MEEPPMMLDGARVIEYAALEQGPSRSGHASVVVEGISLDLETVRGLVIAEDLVRGGVFLIHCNRDWETVAVGHHADLQAARASADYAYSAIAPRWTPYRELSAEERAEVESTRAFLREISQQFPED
jgi:hypothetical protein